MPFDDQTITDILAGVMKHVHSILCENCFLGCTYSERNICTRAVYVRTGLLTLCTTNFKTIHGPVAENEPLDITYSAFIKKKPLGMVPHKRRLKPINSYRVRGRVLQWIKL